MRANSLLLVIVLLLSATTQFGLAEVRQRVAGNAQMAALPSEEAMGFSTWKTPARLRRKFSKSNGTLIVDAQGVSFQPDKGPALHWSFEEIETLFLGSRKLSVKTYEPRGRLWPGTSEVHFDLGSNLPASVAAELAERVQKPSRNGDPVEKRAAIASLPAHHRSAWGGGSNGVLKFHEEGIDYVSRIGKDSRSWRWGDIQEITNQDPYHLIVFGYRETYSFDLKGPLPPGLYDRLTDEVYDHNVKK